MWDRRKKDKNGKAQRKERDEQREERRRKQEERRNKREKMWGVKIEGKATFPTFWF